MDRKSFFKRLGVLTVGAVAISAGIPSEDIKIAPSRTDENGHFKYTEQKIHQCDIYLIDDIQYYVLEVNDSFVRLTDIQNPHSLAFDISIKEFHKKQPRKVCAAVGEWT